MRVTFSINYESGVNLRTINTVEDLVSYRKEALTNVAKMLETYNDPAKEIPTLESISTSMEPTSLLIHLDSKFENRNPLQLVNMHRKSILASSLGDMETFTMIGHPVDNEIQPDSQIIITATNKTLNQYGVQCTEDAGVAYIPLADIVKAFDARLGNQSSSSIGSCCDTSEEQRVNGDIGSGNPLFIKNIPLYLRSRDEPSIKGSVSLVIHKIELEPKITLNHRILPTHNVTQNIPILRGAVEAYLSQFTSEIGSFVAIAKNAEQLNCPLYPSENTFVGSLTDEGILNVPLPAYVRFENLDIDVSFHVTMLKILIDRQYPIRPKRLGPRVSPGSNGPTIEEEEEEEDGNDSDEDTERNSLSSSGEEPPDEDEEEEENNQEAAEFARPDGDLGKIQNNHLIRFYHSTMNAGTRHRARLMAKFLVLYVQTMDYIGDSTYSEQMESKVPIEMFSEIHLHLSGDCEDSARGILRQFNTFVDSAPHLVLLYRCLRPIMNNHDEGNLYDQGTRQLLSIHMGKVDPSTMTEQDVSRLLVTYHNDEAFWSNISRHLDEQRKQYLTEMNKVTQVVSFESPKDGIKISVSKNLNDGSLNYYGGCLEALVLCLVLREAHRLACYYIDSFSLFGVRATHVQKIPKRGLRDVGKNKQSKPKKRTSEEMATEPVGGAHAAVILWPYRFFKETIARWDPDHELATEKAYTSWIESHGYSLSEEPLAKTFPKFKLKDLEPLILEGTGMLEPSSKKDEIPRTRLQLSQIDFLSMVKKELNPDHLDSPFYQSVTLAVTPRFMSSHRIASFNVTQKIDVDAVVSNPETLMSRNVLRGLRTNEELLSEQIGSSFCGGGKREDDDDQNRIASYMNNHLVSGDLYSKGTPFANIMSQQSNVVLVPFGFSRKLVDKWITTTRASIHTRSPDSHLLASPINAIASSVIGQDFTGNTTMVLKNMTKISKYINREYIMEDGKSVCEFDVTTLGLIDAVAKQAPMVPLITSSKVMGNPVQNSIELSRLANGPYKRFDALTLAFGTEIPKDAVRQSIFIKPEQLPTEKSINAFIEDIKKSTPEDFVHHVDYNVEHYTNQSSAIRIDLYVKNIE